MIKNYKHPITEFNSVMGSTSPLGRQKRLHVDVEHEGPGEAEVKNNAWDKPTSTFGQTELVLSVVQKESELSKHFRIKRKKR